jgi:hypothetical protein
VTSRKRRERLAHKSQRTREDQLASRLRDAIVTNPSLTLDVTIEAYLGDSGTNKIYLMDEEGYRYRVTVQGIGRMGFGERRNNGE